MNTRIRLGFLVGCLFLMVGCEKPGEGAKAELGYAVCSPIIAALERFYAQNERYPEVLSELVPAYLEDVPPEVNGEPIEYRVTSTSYELTFSYSGPGRNTCTYTPEGSWKCRGYY